MIGTIADGFISRSNPLLIVLDDLGVGAWPDAWGHDEELITQLTA
jgi:hypothetical protein